MSAAPGEDGRVGAVAWEPTVQVRPASGTPEGAIVLLHGRGSSEHDLQGLIERLDPERQLLGITPRAPLSLPPGGAHWYVVPRVGHPDPQTFQASWAGLTGWLDSLPQRTGVPLDRTILGGFSQGAVMSYAASLGPERPSPAGILALSGFIPTVPGFELELSHRSGLPVAIAHGALDPVIPVSFAHDARDRLAAAGLHVDFRESPLLDHRVDPAGIEDLRAWLAGVLDRVATSGPAA